MSSLRYNTLNRVKTLDHRRGACSLCGLQNLPAEQPAVKLDEFKVSRRDAKSAREMIPLVSV